MLKRTVSMLLALCLLLSAMVVAPTAYAAEVITGDIILDHVPKPVIGAAPATSFPLPEGAKYTLKSVSWTTWDLNQGYVPVTTPFTTASYTMYVTLEAQEGYFFSGNTLYVNGYATRYFYDNDEGTEISFTVDHSFLTPIEGVDIIGVTEPTLGGAVTTAGISVDADAPYTVYDAAWLDSNRSPVSGTFAAKDTYTLKLTLAPKAGYEFDTSIHPPISVNGQVQDTYLAFEGALSTVRITYSLKDSIESPAVIGVTPAAVGAAATVADIATPVGANYTVSADWLDENNNTVQGVFEDKKDYTLRLNLKANDGCEFNADSVNVNGTEIAVGSYGTTEFTVNLDYSFKTLIQTVELTKPVEAAGAAVSSDNVTVPQGASYAVRDAYWRYQDQDGYLYNGTLEAGKAYHFTAELYPQEGYRFADDLVVKVNGVATDKFHHENQFLYITNRVSYKIPISAVEFPALPEIAVGQKANLTVPQPPAGANYTYGIYWHSVHRNQLTRFIGSFENQKIYLYEIYAIPNKGYEFAENASVTIGGKAAQENQFDNYIAGVMTERYYPLGLTVIDRIELQLTKPAAGAQIQTEDVRIPADANYILQYYNWHESDTAELNYYTVNNNLYKEGKYYWGEMSLVAKNGYVFSDQLIVTVNGKPMEIEKIFSLDPTDIDVRLGFGQLKTLQLQNSSAIFKDVKSNQWYKPYVDYVYTTGLMDGMGNSKFAPSSTMTRAMFVTVLARIAGIDTKNNNNITTQFSDVKSGQWYTAAVNWASENKIVNGIGNGKFDPNAQIKRQDICVMLLRYANVMNIIPQKKVAKAAFADDNKIQSYAKEAVYTCQQAGIVKGKEKNKFDPRGYATRAEVAKMLSIFHQDYIA